MSKSAAGFRALNLTPKSVSTTMNSTLLDDDDFTERVLFVQESDAGVRLAVEGGGVGGPSGGALAELDAEQARQLADALNDTADDLDRRAGRDQ